MPVINIILDGEGCWPDLAPDRTIEAIAPIQMAVLPAGMESGMESVSIRLDLPDGTIVIAQTSLAALRTALHTIGGRYPDPLV